MNKNLSIIVFIAAAMICSQAQANRMQKIRSIDELYRRIEPRVEKELTLAVVLFYNREQGHDAVTSASNSQDRKIARQERARIGELIKRQVDRFGRVGRSIREVEFIAADASRDEELKTAFKIRSYPEIRLFKSGKMLIDAQKAPVSLRASFKKDQLLSESAIRSFIKKNIGHDIDKIIKAKARAEFELAKARASAPVVYDYGWGYPYYGGYGYGPYGGVGIGWGGRW